MADYVDKISNEEGDRFWDGHDPKDFKTVEGFKAHVKPTLQGNSTSWVNKQLKVALELVYEDGTREIRDLVAGIIDSIKTSRNSPLAEIGVKNIASPMQDISAEKVKDGASWYQNYPLSIIINELLEKVYKGPTGELPQDKTVNPESLIINSPEGKLGFWNLGVAPAWDGTSFDPAPNATPVTAMCTGIDDNEIFVGLGGVDGTNPAELWRYDPDNDVWNKLGHTSASIPIQELFYNTKDNKIYGVLWKDAANTKVEVEDAANKINWFAPTAKMFKWNPFGEAFSARIDDANHITELGNIFPGKWDIREMFAFTQKTPFGRKEIVGGMAQTTIDGDFKDGIETYKLDSRASVGNFTSFKYVSMPFPCLGFQSQQSHPEKRRGISRYHPRPGANYEQDPLAASYRGGPRPGEFIPGTSGGETSWAGASGTTPPTGFTAASSNGQDPTFTVTAGILQIDHKGEPGCGMNLSISLGEQSRTGTYRIRITLGENCQIIVDDSNFLDSAPFNSKYHPQGWDVEAGFTSSFIEAGLPHDFYITTNGESSLKLSFRPLSASNTAPITIENLSFTPARFYDQWHSLNRQAGENIPITSFSKVVVAAHIRTKTHPESSGSGFSLFDTTHEDEKRLIANSNSNSWSDEVILEANLIGQDRRLLNGGTFPADPPLYGPSEAEDGIPPDNFIRKRMLVDNFDLAEGVGFPYNEAFIFDVAPSVNQSDLTGDPETYTLNIDGNATETAFRSFRSGNGYLSINLQTIGPRVTEMVSVYDSNEDFVKTGMVRYTNGQQGLFVFSQEADNGNGAILLCRPDPTITPLDTNRFNWGPSGTAGQARFRVKYSIFKCSDYSIQDITGPKITKVIAAQPPLLEGGDAWSPIYPTCGCADKQGNFYIGAIESRAHTLLYDGSNEDDIINESFILKFAFGIGAITTSPTCTTEYSSLQDNTIYNTTGPTTMGGNISNEYASESAQNKTRKFGWLHWQEGFTEKLMGWSFKRDSILSDPGLTPALPCHEVFTLTPNANQLRIIDHDTQDASNPDSVGFLAFLNTEGDFATTIYPELEGKEVTWYFRYKKPTSNPQVYYKVGFGLQLCYAYQDDAGVLQGGQFWDEEAENLGTISLYQDEGFLSHTKAVRAIIDKGVSLEREALFSSFDKTLHSSHLSKETQDNSGLSSRLFFKLDELDKDPRARLYDFKDLQIWDAISKLSVANELAFGFDIDDFFLLPVHRAQISHTLKAVEGDLLDLEKITDNEIRNVISLQPYREQLGDITWEITHVGPEETLQDSTLFNGELTMNAQTPKQASVNLICTRGGRAFTVDQEYTEQDSLILQDANDSVYDRDPILFKWLTHSPTKEITLMKKVMASDTTLYVNTLYLKSNTSIVPGELVIFTNPDTFEQIGIIIDSIDPVLNRINLEKNPGFEIEQFTPITIVSSNIGTQNDGPPNYSTTIKNWSTIFSDEGIAVITEDPTLNAEGETELTVNNIEAFREARFPTYREGNKYYPFLVTVYSSSVISEATLPPAGASSNAPIAWVKGIDISNYKLILDKNYSKAFKKGDVLKGHYALPPARDKREPSPLSSISSTLPNGLANFTFVCDPSTDRWNPGDIINLQFEGLHLIKEEGSIFTGADIKSITRYGEKSWQVPDNRFITYDRVGMRVIQYLKEFSQPGYLITASIPFDMDMSFVVPGTSLLRSVEVIDPIMLKGFTEHKISGRIKKIVVNVSSLKMQLEFKTDQKL